MPRGPPRARRQDGRNDGSPHAPPPGPDPRPPAQVEDRKSPGCRPRESRRNFAPARVDSGGSGVGECDDAPEPPDTEQLVDGAAGGDGAATGPACAGWWPSEVRPWD